MDIQQIKNYILDNSLSEAFAEESLLTFVREQLHDFGRLMAFYRCAMMEVETKFNVISEDLPTNTNATLLKTSSHASKSLQAFAPSLNAAVIP